MRYIIKIFNKEIKFESNELSEIEVKSIESKILSDLESLKNKEIISTLDQLITLLVDYAVEKYLIEKKHKTISARLSAKIDDINELVRSSIDKDTLF